MVKVEGLSKEFLGRNDSAGCKYNIGEGKIYGLVGMNGSGKDGIYEVPLRFLEADNRKSYGGCSAKSGRRSSTRLGLNDRNTGIYTVYVRQE